MLNSVSVTVDDLAAALAQLAPFCPKRATLPILSCVHASVEPGALLLRATDLESAGRVSIDAAWSQIDDDGRPWAVAPGALAVDLLCINRADLAAAIKGQPKGGRVRLTFANNPPGPSTIPAGNVSVHLPAGGSVRLPGISVSDFPTAPTFDGVTEGDGGAPAVVLSMPGEDFANIVGQVAPFAASDDSRPILRAVMIDPDHGDGILTVAASDGFRLSYYRGPAPFMSRPGAIDWDGGPVMIDASHLSHVAKIAAKARRRVTIDRGMIHRYPWALIRAGRMEVWTRIVEGNPPAYLSILPTGAAWSAQLDGAALYRVLSAAAPAAKVAANVTRFDPFLGNEPRFDIAAGSVKATDEPSFAAAVPLTDYSGQVDSFAVSCAFLRDFVDAVGGSKAPTLTIARGPGDRAPLALSSTNAPHLTHVLMPMHVER